MNVTHLTLFARVAYAVHDAPEAAAVVRLRCGSNAQAGAQTRVAGSVTESSNTSISFEETHKSHSITTLMRYAHLAFHLRQADTTAAYILRTSDYTLPPQNPSKQQPPASKAKQALLLPDLPPLSSLFISCRPPAALLVVHQLKDRRPSIFIL